MTATQLALVLLSAALHALWNLGTKRSRDATIFLGLFQLVTLAASLLVAPLVRWSEVPRGVWLLLPMTTLVHYFYQRWLAAAYTEGDLSVVYPITRSTAAFVAVLGPLVLGDPLSATGALGVGVVLVGIWLVSTHGHLDLRRLVAPDTRFAWLTLAATVGYTLADKAAMVHLDRAPWTSPVPKGAAFFLLVNAAPLVVYAPWMARRYGVRAIADQARAEWWPVVGAAAGSAASYILVLEALRTAPAGYVVATRQISVLFAAGLGVLVLGERASAARTAGAALTVAGVAIIGLAG